MNTSTSTSADRIALVTYAIAGNQFRLVRAHNLPEPNISTRLLAKRGFKQIGDHIAPEDSRIWRWEKSGEANRISNRDRRRKGATA